MAPRVGSLLPGQEELSPAEAAAGAPPEQNGPEKTGASVVCVITCACEGTESSPSGCRGLGGMVLGCPLLTAFLRLTCP